MDPENIYELLSLTFSFFLTEDTCAFVCMNGSDTPPVYVVSNVFYSTTINDDGLTLRFNLTGNAHNQHQTLELIVTITLTMVFWSIFFSCCL